MKDECWLVPKPTHHRMMRSRVLSYMDFDGRMAVEVCEQPTCINPDHLVNTQSEAGRMLYIKQRTVQEGDCLVWTGMFSEYGAPVMPWKKEGQKSHVQASVRRFIWQQENMRYDEASGKVLLTCDSLLCVNHRHLVWVKPMRLECPNGHVVDPMSRYACRKCELPKSTLTCERGHKHSSGEASIISVVGCHHCRREDAEVFMKARNEEALKAGHL